jgi:hypothetical protein
MPAGNNTGTDRTDEELLDLYADSQPAKSSLRQLHRDHIYSHRNPWPILAAEVGLVTVANSKMYAYGDARRYGVNADGQFISNGVMNGTTAVLTSASNPFVATDVGKLCLVPGAGAAGALLTTTIASYQGANQVTLAVASQTAVAAASVTWGTDDTAAWIAVQAAAVAGARITIPLGYSLITDVFMGGITKSLDLEGLAVSEVWGTESQSSATSIPGIVPYITGSVIVQCAAGKDTIQITGSGVTVHRRNFGIKFADGIAFLNTGHGVYAASTAMISAGHDNGETGSRVDTVLVFGHDGNHYSYYSVNANLMTIDHHRSYGGGVMHIECDSYASNYGNHEINHSYGSLFCGGTAHGYDLVSRTSAFPGILNLILFTRPQVNVQAVPARWAGLGIPACTVAQYLWHAGGAGTPQHIGIIAPNLEADLGGVASPVDFLTGLQYVWRGFVAANYPLEIQKGPFDVLGVDQRDLSGTGQASGLHLRQYAGTPRLTFTLLGTQGTEIDMSGNVTRFLSAAGGFGATAGGKHTANSGVVLAAVAPTVAASQVGLGGTTATTVGAAGGASALPATPTGYLVINVAGTQMKVPYYAT